MIKIEIDNEDMFAGKVAELLLQRLAEREDHYERDSVAKAIKQTVDRLVEKHANEMLPEMLRPKIAEALEGNFGTSDEYGNNKPRTLRSLIVDSFKSTYNHREGLVTELVNKTVTALMKEEFQPAIDSARKELRSKLDHILGEKVSLAVREAVGLR